MLALGPFGNAAEELAFSFLETFLASPPQRGGGLKGRRGSLCRHGVLTATLPRNWPSLFSRKEKQKSKRHAPVWTNPLESPFFRPGPRNRTFVLCLGMSS